MSPREINAAVDRVRAEFIEMPGLRLTVPQAARFLGLDRAACDDVIGTLENRRFLRRTSGGFVIRADDAR
jgi:hypothetical protein